MAQKTKIGILVLLTAFLTFGNIYAQESAKESIFDFDQGNNCEGFPDDISYFNKEIELHPKSSDAYWFRGNFYLKEGNYDQALSDYNKAIELDSNNANAYCSNCGHGCGRAAVYAYKSNHDQAIADCSKAIEIDPNDAVAYAYRGVYYAAKGNSDQALSDLNKATELNPNLIIAYRTRGKLYAAKGNHDKAIAEFSKVIEHEPYLVGDYYSERGASYEAKGDRDKATADYDKAEEINSWWRSIKQGMRNSDQIISDCNRAIELDPKDAYAYYERGLAYDRKGNPDQAIADCSKAIELHPNFTKAYYVRGLIYVDRGNFNQAISDYTKAIELDPRFAEAYYKRGVAYFNKKDYDKSWNDIRKAEALLYQVDSDFIAKLEKASGRMLLASDNIYDKQQNNPRLQDIKKIKIEVTTEKEILNLFGKPHLVKDVDQKGESKNSDFYFYWGQKIFEKPKPNQRIIFYEFLNSQGGWTGGYLLIIIINKKNNLVENLKTDYTFEDIIPAMP